MVWILVHAHWEDADGHVVPVADTTALEKAWEEFVAANPDDVPLAVTSRGCTKLLRLYGGLSTFVHPLGGDTALEKHLDFPYKIKPVLK